MHGTTQKETTTAMHDHERSTRGRDPQTRRHHSPCVLIVHYVQRRSNVDILGMLERDAGKVSPFLAGRRGSFYMGGQSLAANNPLTSLWPVKENETLGFMHPYFRDARARGIAITCDEVTGCGHSLNDWEFYRDTRVLNGSVIVDNTRVYSNPAPTTLRWRPDRVTARYDIEPGVVLQEVKFFTNDDVLLDIVTLLPAKSTDGHATLLR